jgi:hypothetical protein
MEKTISDHRQLQEATVGSSCKLVNNDREIKRENLRLHSHVTYIIDVFEGEQGYDVKVEVVSNMYDIARALLGS